MVLVPGTSPGLRFNHLTRALPAWRFTEAFSQFNTGAVLRAISQRLSSSPALQPGDAW
jgi:hypothetical protein